VDREDSDMCSYLGESSNWLQPGPPSYNFRVLRVVCIVVRRSAGALRAPNPDFESVCHAPRGEKETAWFWIWKFGPIFFRKSRIPSGFSLEAIISPVLLAPAIAELSLCLWLLFKGGKIREMKS